MQVRPLNDITIEPSSSSRDAWYILDAGTLDWVGGVPGLDMMWLNGFEIIPGAGIIDQVGVYWGAVPDGMKARLILYNDPDNDGHPDDAVYLTEQEVDVQQMQYIDYDFPPTPISSKFFVAALLSDTTIGPSSYPMVWDTDWYSQASWMAYSTLGDFDVTNLTNNMQPPISMHLFFPGYAGDFVIRAHGTSMPEVPVLIIDMDGNTNSGPVMAGLLDDLSIHYDYQTYFPRNSLQNYLSVFVCLGVYGTNHVLSVPEGQLLADYLNSGGRLYMEGGDTWAWDPPSVVHPMFKINGIANGLGDMGPISGMFGTFTDCMSFTYSGDNIYMDHIDYISPAYRIFRNVSPSYYTGVAYDAGYYKTIGTSFEFGGLDNASYPSTKAELMKRYLDFFDVLVPLISVEPEFLRAYLVSGQNDSSMIKLNNSSATVDSYQVGIQYTDAAGVPLLPAAPQFPEQKTQPNQEKSHVKFHKGEKPSSGLAPPTNAYVKKAPSIRNTMAPTSKAFAYNVSPGSSSDPLGPMSFYLNNPGNVTNIGPALPNFVAGADWANGKWYGITSSSGNLVQIDTSTGNYTTIGATGVTDLTSLAWDRTTGTMYTVSGFTGNLYSIDMTTGNITFIATTIPNIISMAVTNDGSLYGIDILNDVFGSINKATGVWTTISSLPFDANYAHDMAIDREDNKIYYAPYNATVWGGQLWSIDHASGGFTYIGDFEGGMEVTGFAILCQEWLTVDPLAGIIGPYGSANINAHYNAAGLSSGDYYANLNIYFSDPDSTITVPVHLTVGEPEINVEPTTIYLHPTHPLPPPPPIANTIDQPDVTISGAAQNPKKEDYIPGQMLIKFSDDVIVNEGRSMTNYDLINEILREYRISKMKQLFKQNGINDALKREMGLYSIYVVNFPKSRDVFTVVNAFKALRQVTYAEPDYLAYADIIPPDPMFPDQWGLQNTGQVVPAGRAVGTPGADIGAVMAWDMETGNSSVTVAVIDEGVDLTHPEFAGRLLPGYDFFNDDSDPSPYLNDAHGTACAGIVGAAQNGVGVVGVAWGVNILPVKVMELGIGPWSAISSGIVFSADQGADILSMSLGSTSYSPTLNSAVNYAYFSGAVLIAAAGNANTDIGIVQHYPASFSNVISVGALSPCNNRKSPSTCDGETWWGSNYGGGLDFLAPGVRIPTTDIVGAAGYSSTNYVATFSGTSSACPYAAGVAALVLSHNPLLSSSAVRYLLQSSCVDLGASGYDDDTGYGRLDAYMALLYAGGANSFEIFNQGTGPLTITSITDNQDWLSTNIPPGPGQTISTSSRGAEGATWDEVVAYNNVILYNNEGVEPSTGRAPGGKKPIILENPNPDVRGMASNSFAYNADPNASIDPEGPMSFNLTSPEDVTIIGPSLYNSSDFVAGAAWANGIWYGITYLGDSLITLDTTNGSYFKIAETTHAHAMAWDPTTSTMYISSWTGVISELYTIDLNTGVTTLIGSNSVHIIAMACTNEGDLYAIDIIIDDFGSINKTTGAWTPISALPFNANYAQDMTTDREDNKLYYAAYNTSAGAGQLWSIDHVSGVLTYISTFEGGMAVTGFIIPTNLGRKIQPNNSLLVNTFIDWNLLGTTRSRSTGTITILSDDADEPTVNVTVNVSSDSIRSNTVIEDDTIHTAEEECYEGQYVIIAGGNGKTFVVENGGSATLVAGRKIFLKPGVKVEQGGYLLAYISTDGLYCPSSPPPIPEVLVVADDLFEEINSEEDSYIEAYPNPTTGHLTVNIMTDDIWTSLVEIYDFTGRRLIARQLQTNETFEFDLSSYKNGIYFIKATWGKHMGIKRVVKH